MRSVKIPSNVFNDKEISFLLSAILGIKNIQTNCNEINVGLNLGLRKGLGISDAIAPVEVIYEDIDSIKRMPVNIIISNEFRLKYNCDLFCKILASLLYDDRFREYSNFTRCDFFIIKYLLKNYLTLLSFGLFRNGKDEVAIVESSNLSYEFIKLDKMLLKMARGI